jgi:hypothetical protein
MVFNVTFNNTSAISWWSVLLVEETGVPCGKPPTCRKSLTGTHIRAEIQKKEKQIAQVKVRAHDTIFHPIFPFDSLST